MSHISSLCVKNPHALNFVYVLKIMQVRGCTYSELDRTCMVGEMVTTYRGLNILTERGVTYSVLTVSINVHVSLTMSLKDMSAPC